MKLTELEPRWYGTMASSEIVGMSFLCPHCLKIRLSIRFSLDAPYILIPDGAIHLQPEKVWQIKGDAATFEGLKHGGFDNVTVLPSIDASSTGHWHGSITNGKVT